MQYQFLNLNPLNKRQKDCVCRAIAGATNQDYYLIEDKLYAIAFLHDCDKLCVCCYYHLIEDVYNGQSIDISKYEPMTIREFLDRNPIGKFIFRVNQHLTWANNGILCDTWDCSNEIITHVWKLK